MPRGGHNIHLWVRRACRELVRGQVTWLIQTENSVLGWGILMKRLEGPSIGVGLEEVGSG